MSSIIINKILVHYIDLEHNKILLSEKFVNLESKISDYYKNRLEKTLSDQNLREIIDFEYNLFDKAKCMTYQESNIINLSQEITKDLFRFGRQIDEMPNSNVVFIDFKLDGKNHLAIMKLDHKLLPTNIVNQSDNLSELMLIQNITPSTTKADEALIFNIEDNKLHLLEKKYSIDGKKSFYLNEHYLHGTKLLTDKEKFEYLVKVVNKVNEDFRYSDLPGSVLLKYTVYNMQVLIALTVKDIVLNVFNEKQQCIDEVMGILIDLGIKEDEAIDNILEKCELVTIKINDEIKFDLNINDYVDKISFEMNEDNKSITIKDVFDYKIN